MPLVISPKATLFAALSPSQISERRHHFAAKPFPTTATTTTSPEQKQYSSGNGWFESAPNQQNGYSPRQPQQFSYDAPPEPVKVYRKSPFLPRKKNNAEGGAPSLTVKKESKLSSLGSTLLKNLTTSPFSQRRQQPPPAASVQQPELHHFPSQPQYGGGYVEANPAPLLVSHSPIPRRVYHQSPLLQRRNPSYATYDECQPPSIPGRTSANTSPIGKHSQ